MNLIEKGVQATDTLFVSSIGITIYLREILSTKIFEVKKLFTALKRHTLNLTD